MAHLVVLVIGLWWLWLALAGVLSALAGALWCALFLRSSDEEVEARRRVARLAERNAAAARREKIRRELMG